MIEDRGLFHALQQEFTEKLVFLFGPISASGLINSLNLQVIFVEVCGELGDIIKCLIY